MAVRVAANEQHNYPDEADFEASGAWPGVGMNRTDNHGVTDDVKRLRCDLAELNEMVRLGASIPGDEERIEMIKKLLARQRKTAPVTIIDTVP